MSKRLSECVARDALARVRALSIDEFERFTFDEFLSTAFQGWRRVAKSKADPLHPRYLFSRPTSGGGDEWALYAPRVNHRYNGAFVVGAWESIDLRSRLSVLSQSFRFPDVLAAGSEAELYALLPEKRQVVFTAPDEVTACADWVVAKLPGATGDAIRMMHALLAGLPVAVAAI